MSASPRRGAVLLLIAGVIAMLAVLAYAFLARMRTDAQETRAMLQSGQCRLMLHAGMSFIQESSRLGYASMSADGTACLEPREAWGWIDVRSLGVTNRIGPRGRGGEALFTPGRWPAPGTIKRAPMSVMKRPPYAVVPNMAPNAMPSDPGDPVNFGIPMLRNPDPLPALDATRFTSHDPANLTAMRDWVAGDPTPEGRTVGLAWFRVYRETGAEPDRPLHAGPAGATFVITAGSGGTLGFRDWREVLSDGESARFRNDEALFNELAAGELRQWYRVEWSAAVSSGDNKHYMDDSMGLAGGGPAATPHARVPINGSRFIENGQGVQGSTEPRNYIGTIRYIQRLFTPPQSY